MKIGSIGRGMVGEAIFKGLKDLGNEMTFYDPVYKESKMSDIYDSQCCFIAVPTLPNEQNECDLTIITKVLDELHDMKYNGVICIKSTITPGTTEKMIKKYNNDNICFCPEFLKERCAYTDFIQNNPICVVGTVKEEVFNVIKEIHMPISNIFKMVSPIEAELTKYMQNVYNTYRILFANGFYEVCKYNNVEYNSVLHSLLYRNELDEKYMKCSEELRGPSGPCLVKDSLAFNQYVKTLDLDIKPNIFQTIVDDMKLYPRTVIEGTRTEKEYFGKELNKNMKIIITNDSNRTCFGHDLHITRCIVLDMLLQNHINKDDILVVMNNDRKFLYELLFNTVLSYHEYTSLNINTTNIIDLRAFSLLATCNRDKFFIPNFSFSGNYYTEEFRKKMLQINYCDTKYNIFDNDYIVIHYRYDADLNNLKKICDKITNTYYNMNLIIFNHNIENISSIREYYKDTNIIFTDNLQLYASYLNNSKCKMVISEWSGGGQLSQYCFSGKIFYYFDFYTSLNWKYERNENRFIKFDFQNFQNISLTNTYFHDYDLKNPMNGDIKIFNNVDELLLAIDN